MLLLLLLQRLFARGPKWIGLAVEGVGQGVHFAAALPRVTLGGGRRHGCVLTPLWSVFVGS